MANFVSSITLQFRDLFSQGMAQAQTSVMRLQSSLNDINPGGLADLSASAIDIPAPAIGRPVIPAPEISGMDELEEMLGGSLAHLGGMSDALDGIGKGFDGITPKAGIFDKGLEEIQAGLDKIAENNALNTLATQLSVMNMAVGPIQQSLNNMMEQPSKLAGSFESSMKNIQAITGATGAEIDALSANLLDVGGKSAAGPQAVADAFNDVAGGIAIVSPGVALLDVQMQVLANSLALAEAGQADLGTAAEGLTKIMNSYRFTMGSVEEVNGRAAWAADVMTQAVGMGMGSMQEFISAMAPLSGAAASVGIGFDEIGSTLAYMTSTTDTAATAGTKLESFMIALQKPSDDLSSALARMGYASGTAMLAELGLAESARVVSAAFGGNQDAITQAMGRAEAMKAVISLTGEAYGDFAAEFGQAMQTAVTAEAQAVQQQSYESKVARLQAATDSLQIQIGGNINAIKGFFVDMGAFFLTDVVSPIMSSPIGGVFQEVAAVVGVAGQGLLSFGGTALTTAVQFTTLAANIKNAGGYAKIFHGTMTVMQAPFKAVGGMVKGFITNLFGIGASSLTAAGGTTAMGVASGASAAPIGAATVATGGLGVALNSVLWPILAVVAAVALVAGGAYLLIKNWEAVSAFFVNLWNKITGVFSAASDWIKNSFTVVITWIGAFFQSLWASVVEAFAPVAEWFAGIWSGITAAFSNAWSAAASFFSDLWGNITNFVSSVAVWFVSVWNNAVIGFSNIWNNVSLFFTNLWNGITGIVANAANWFAGIWGTATAPFAEAFVWIGNLFTSIWDGIKGVVTRFVAWMSPVVDAILAPFRAIGNVIGGIINTVGGVFGKAADAGNEAVMNMRTGLAEDAAPGIANTTAATVTGTAAPEPRVSIAPPDTGTAVAATPDLGAPVQAVTTPELGQAIAIPNLAGAGTVAMPEPQSAVTNSAAAIPAQSMAPQAVTATASSGGSSLAMEHIEAARRKGVSASDISYTAALAFENAGAYTPLASTTPMMDVPDIDREARVNFAEAMPSQRQTVIAGSEREAGTAETPRQNIFHIANMNFNADELRTLLDIVRQLELAVMEPEAVTV